MGLTRVAVVHPGDPVAKARARTNRNGHSYTPDHVTAAEDALRWRYKLALPAGFSVDKTSEWAVGARFYTATGRRVDGDNYLKLVMDAANGIVFHDDSQVVEGHFYVQRKVPDPRSEITFWIVE